MIETAFEAAAKSGAGHFEVLPMSVCVALSQGYIGYDLQNALQREFVLRGMAVPVATIITQVEVDPKDEAFLNPTKPVGGFMSAAEAAALSEKGIPVAEDSGRGWRRVVASPKPKRILESETIRAMLAAGQVPIAAGGGGIPVALRQDGQYHGQAAVIDKDFAAAVLADSLDAERLIILTAVEKAAINFGKPDQRWLDTLTPAEAEKYIADGHFGKGSMQPKVQAALNFVKGKKGRVALITELSRALDGIAGKTGTRITA